jgi:hypothetical protein
MKIKVIATRELVVTESTEFEFEVPGFLISKVVDDEQHLSRFPINRVERLGETLAQEALNQQATQLTWTPQGAAEARSVRVKDYRIVKQKVEA